MNAAGLTFTVAGVSGALDMPFFQALVADGQLSQNELDGTRSNLAGVLAILRKTPTEKIEALVAKYDPQLTEHLNKFNANWGEDVLGGFREVQIMAGYVTTIMAKAGLHK
ncbi:MAG TPA: hypothetical protein VF656_03970 [Pyrinomonadaceae bacterium]|jgi:hypothetical protein